MADHSADHSDMVDWLDDGEQICKVDDVQKH